MLNFYIFFILNPTTQGLSGGELQSKLMLLQWIDIETLKGLGIETRLWQAHTHSI